MIIHYIQHNFSDWDSQTKHMSHAQIGIFLSLRTMYFGNASKANGKIEAGDFDLLCHRLACKTEEEIALLKLILKDKFKKNGNTYRHADWDRQIKNLDWWYRNQGNIGNDNGNVLGNATGNVGNNQGNVMSNAERTAKAKQERKNIITALQNSDITFDKNAPIATLRQLFADNCGNSNVVAMETQGNDLGNGGNAQGDESGNGGNAEIQAKNYKPLTTNHKPNTQTPPNPQEQKSGVCEGQTAVEVLAKAEQICQANAQDIQDWIAPSLNEMLDMLKLSGFNGGLTEQQYQVSTSDMKTHFTEQAISGKPIKTDSLRKQKLRDWIMRNANKPLAGKSKPTNESRFGTANDPLAVNQMWGQKLSYTANQTYEDYMAEQEDKIARQNPTQSPAGYEEIL